MKRFYILITILILLVSLLPPFPPPAHAGLIFRIPSNLGISSGLVGYWTFDGKIIRGNMLK